MLVCAVFLLVLWLICWQAFVMVARALVQRTGPRCRPRVPLLPVSGPVSGSCAAGLLRLLLPLGACRLIGRLWRSEWLWVLVGVRWVVAQFHCIALILRSPALSICRCGMM